MARKLVVEILGDTSGLERSFARASRSTKGFEHDIGRASRGALSAAVSFQGLGRAMAFSSAQFLGGAGIVFALKSTIQAAEENQRVLGQTSVAVTRAGLSWATYGKQIEAAALKQSNLTGFDDERLLGTFSKLVRATGNVTEALNDNALAANIARGANIDLEKAASIVLRASQGQARGLANIGIAARKGATGLELIALLNQKFSGSAVAFGRTAVGAQDRFRVAIENTQEALGKGALPAITKYLNKASDWLNQSKNQARIQRDVTETVQVLGKALKVAESVIHGVTSAFKEFSGVVGGSKNALELLVGAFAAFKAAKIAASIGQTVSNLVSIGKAAEGATGKVAILRSRLLTLSGGAYVATIAIVAIGAEKVSAEIERLQKQALEAKDAALIKGSGLETTLVPKIAVEIQAKRAAGEIYSQIRADLHQQFGDSSKTDDLIGEAYAFLTRSNPALTARIDKNIDKRSQHALARIIAARDKILAALQGLADAATAAAAPPSPTGLAALTPAGRNALALSRAAGTDTTADDLKALADKQVLLSKAIATETARLNSAATPKLAQKFADNLKGLIDQRNGVLDEIKGIQQTAAADAKAKADAIAQAAQDAADAFIAALSFNVDKAGATATLTDNLATEQALVAGIQKEIAQTGDIVKYRSQLLAAQEAVVATKHDMGQQMLDALSFGVDKAAVSGSFAKQFAANAAYQQGIKTLIAQEGATLELQRQLFDAQQNRIAIQQAQQQQIAERRRAAEEAAQKEAEERNAAAERNAEITRAFIASNRTKAQTARERTLELLSFGVTKAEATASFKDDLARNEALRAGIIAQIRGGHKTQALVEQLFAVNQTITQTRVKARDAIQAARTAAQFKTLGLGPTGGELAPAQADLRKQLGTVTQAVSGTFLDTSKTRGILAHVRNLLKGGLGSLSDEVRTALKKILDDTDQQLKNHGGDRTKFRHITTGKILAGLDLTVDQRRALQGRIGQIGASGTVPQRTSQFSAAGGGTGMTVHIEHFHSSAENPRQLEDELEKRARSRAITRRGA